MTYIATRDGWLDLAVVEDLYSRMVVGSSMEATMTSRKVVDALAMKCRLLEEEFLRYEHLVQGTAYVRATG